MSGCHEGGKRAAIQKVEGVVYVDAAPVELPIGTTLVAVEGTPIEELLDRFASRSTVDGDRPEVRAAQAVREFARQILLEYGGKSEWEITVRERGSTAATSLRLPGVTLAELPELHAQRISAPGWGSPSRAEKPWPFVETVDADSEAVVLRVPTFGVSDLQEFERRVDEVFEQVPSQAPLAVDLRGNEGGIRQNGVAILNHLLAESYVQWLEVTTRVRSIPRPFRDRVSFEFVPKEALEEFPGAESADGWTFEGDPLRDLMQPESPRHQGPLTVFVDDATNSAAIEFVAALLAHREGVRVVGTETQGECGRHVGQMPVLYEVDAELTLLLSLFEIDHVRYPGCKAGRGVQPDIPIRYQRAQFLDGEDPFSEAWLEDP